MRTPDSSEPGEGLDTHQLRGALERKLFGSELDAVRVGRFVVIDKLGQGGMGTVFRAYDPDLDRTVAIKLLKKSLRGEEDQQARLVREAKALAKLNHPNVVGVHEVGRVAERIFVAMEYVQGRDLKAWADALPPAGRERYRRALEVLLQAGTGLAAAHDVGLIHRDLKPTNILVGDDGRTRVADFGLARSELGDEPSLDSASGSSPGSGSGSGDDPLTRTGAVLGTPAYMAPEQSGGEAVSARADQFSFCLTAWEVLFGQRPWKQPIPIDTDSVLPPPERSATARYLCRCLARGLASDPARRYPALRELLAALRHDPGRARRRWFALGGTAASLAVLGSAYAFERETRCDEVGAVLASGSSAAIATAFDDTGAPDADASFERAWSGVEAYADAWYEVARTACREAKIDGGLPAETYALTKRCLEDRSHRLAALLEVFADADRDVVRRSVQAVATLPEPRDCHDADLVRAEAPLPDDPQLTAGVLEVRATLARGRAQWAAGHLDQAREAFEGVVDHPATQEYGPLRAELDALRGTLADAQNDHEVAARALEAAYWTGLEVRHDVAAAKAARSLAIHFATRNQLDDAQRWLKAAETLTVRARSSDSDRANLLAVKARVIAQTGRYEEAESLLVQAQAIVEDKPIERAHHGRNLVLVYAKQARFAEALATSLEVKEQLAEALGPDHFELAALYHNMGGIYTSMGKPEQAKTAAYRGLEIRRRTYGDGHPSVASSYQMLGRIDYRSGDPKGAKALFEKALEIAVETRPPGDPLIGKSTSSLAAALVDLGEYDRALELERELLATRIELLGELHPDTAHSYRAIGRTLAELGRNVEAIEFLQKADAGYIDAFGPSHGAALDHRNLLARTLTAAGRLDNALELLDEAIPAARTSGDATPELVMLLTQRAVTRMKTGDRAGALVDSAEAVVLARALGDKTPDRIIAIHKAIRLLVDAGKHREATELADEGLDGPIDGARPQDRAAFLIAHALALEPIDATQALRQAKAAEQVYRDGGAAVPPELARALERLPAQ